MNARDRNERLEEGMEMSLWNAMLFFRFCMRHKITDRQDKVALLREMVRRKRAKYLRDVQARMAGKKILRIRGKNAD